ncbi:uncharacterized protein H6S33_004437 [Morchella sextelata]|uniref:uncharacterized protein n=1 Tax=Morchella sextelata TaxID=1174677 RepID=UPI001D03D523|nr:uncharacterized protein H6S33_004437 [Morchella sextelata]KAH0605980.1 hypothetical protein H6S33_004437 [Morchella sextelata]
MSTTTLTQAPAPVSTFNSTPTPTTAAAPTHPPHGDVPTVINFHPPTTIDGAPPYLIVEDLQSNFSTIPHPVTIHDLRGLEADFNLDKQAFQPVLDVPSTEKDFTDDAKIEREYYPEITAILKKHVPGIEEVVIFDHTVRRAGPDAKRPPVMRAHIDQSVPASYQRIRRHLPAERAEEVIAAGTRVRIINVWRPIGGPVVDSPLGCADSRTVEEADVVPVRHILPDREGSTLGVKFREGQKWWYWSGMRDEEVLLIKCFDTDTVVGGGAEGRRGRTPHSAFVHPGTPAEKKGGRESIEVRCLVIG